MLLYLILVELFSALGVGEYVEKKADRDYSQRYEGQTNFETGEDVLKLDDTNFYSKVRALECALIMFYKPGCKYCKKLEPEFEDAGGYLLANEPPVQLAKVDCTEEDDICDSFGVKAYPTLKIFRYGKLSADYKGPREVAGIVRFMRSQVAPATRLVKTVKELKVMLGHTAVVVYGLGEDDDELIKSFNKVSAMLQEAVVFARSSEAIIFEELGIGLTSAVVLARPRHLQTKFEAWKKVYDGVHNDPAAMANWIKNNYHGLCGYRHHDNISDFPNYLSVVVVYYNVDFEKDPKGTKYWRNRVMKIAKEHPEFTYAISNRFDFQMELEEFGFYKTVKNVKADIPIVTAIDDKGRRFRMEPAFTMESFEEFLIGVKTGKLKPFFKSQPVPHTQGNVKVAVAKNLDLLVMYNNKDVLLEFFDPSCEKCKKLAPILDELGEIMKNEDINIVKMDATANDIPLKLSNPKSLPFAVPTEFPTIYWIRVYDKKSEPYKGGHELNDFIKFIAEKSSHELDGYTRDGKIRKLDL